MLLQYLITKQVFWYFKKLCHNLKYLNINAAFMHISDAKLEYVE